MKTYKKEDKIHSMFFVLCSSLCFVLLLVFFGFFLPAEYDWCSIEFTEVQKTVA